jgi:hypothetical protein
MMTRQVPGIIAFSDRLYRLLLWLYPADHRREYGPLMAQVFRDQCRTAYLREGALGVLWMWFPLVVDLTVTLVEEHRRKGFSMSKESFARFSSPLLMLGGLAWALSSYSQLQPGSHYVFWGTYQLSIAMIAPGFLLTGAGLIGLQARYGAQVGRVGQAGLLAAVLGAVVSAAGVFAMAVVDDSWWSAFIIGFVLHFVGLLAFALTALRSGALAGRSWLLALVAGIGLIPLIILLFPNAQGEVSGAQWEDFAMLLVIGLGWMAFGFGLRGDQRQPQVARA